MRTKIHLIEMEDYTQFVPLSVLGYCLMRTNFLAPVFSGLSLPLKTVDHTPQAKLCDLLVSILTGCRAVSQVNTRTRPDLVLARAWQRPKFAEQSTLMRTLDCFDQASLAQLRSGSQTIFRQESCTLRHDFDQDWLWVDIDLTPLPISKHAEGSTKGHMGEKTRTVVS